MMRTDEEFKAEVYRRSQKRIQKRNANRRKLVRTVSSSAAILCCVLTVWFAMTLQENKIDKNSHSSQTEIATSIYKEESTKNDFKTQGVESNGVIVMIDVELHSEDGNHQGMYKITNSQEIEAIKKVVADIEEAIKNNELHGVTEYTSGDNSDSAIYIFTLIDSVGEETEYILNGDILALSETKKNYMLTQELKASLLETLRR